MYFCDDTAVPVFGSSVLDMANSSSSWDAFCWCLNFFLRYSSSPIKGSSGLLVKWSYRAIFFKLLIHWAILLYIVKTMAGMFYPVRSTSDIIRRFSGTKIWYVRWASDGIWRSSLMPIWQIKNSSQMSFIHLPNKNLLFENL